MAKNKKSAKKSKGKAAYSPSKKNVNSKNEMLKKSGKKGTASGEALKKNGKKQNSSKKERKKTSDLQEKIIIVVSIIVGVVLIAVLALNIPIITITKTARDGSTYTENVSVLEWFKSRQPMIEKEGALSKDTNSYELNSKAEKVDDNREFTNDQIIEGQFTVLCLGFDEDRSNSDVMMLFLFDIAENKINILQIPRDSFVPDYTSSETGKINSVYTCGDQELIPIQRTVDAVRETFGIPIDRYITTGCKDIIDMVDLIGGIPIDLPEDVIYSYDRILYAGEQVLNGEQAELFVRARQGYIEGDIGRVKAQRIFLAAAMQKALDMGTVEVTKFLTEVYNKGYIGTDLTLKEMSILSDFGGKIDLNDVTVQMVPGEGIRNNGYDVWSIHKKATVDLLNKYFRPYQTDLDYDSLPITEIVEEESQVTDIYDDTKDTLQEIADGATPGESEKATEPVTEDSEESDEEYDGDENDGY